MKKTRSRNSRDTVPLSCIRKNFCEFHIFAKFVWKPLTILAYRAHNHDIHMNPYFNQIYVHSGKCSAQCWNLGTIYGGQKPSRNKIVVPTRQATQAGGIDSLESIPGLFTSLRIPSQLSGLSPEKSNAVHSANRRPGKLHFVTFSHTVHFVSMYYLHIFLPLLYSATSCGSVRNIELYFPLFLSRAH